MKVQIINKSFVYAIEKVPEVIKKLAKISPFQKELNELGL